MCTVTWLRERGGYTLLCNRDESLSRKPALAPAVKEHRGVRFIAPEDGDYKIRRMPSQLAGASSLAEVAYQSRASRLEQ